MHFSKKVVKTQFYTKIVSYYNHVINNCFSQRLSYQSSIFLWLSLLDNRQIENSGHVVEAQMQYIFFHARNLCQSNLKLAPVPESSSLERWLAKILTLA